MNLSPIATTCLPLPSQPLLDYKGEEELRGVLGSIFWLLNALPAPLTPSWTHFSLSDNFSARFVPKKAPPQEEFKTKKAFFFGIDVSCFPAAWLSAVPCLPPWLGTMVLVMGPCFSMVPSSLARNYGVGDGSLLLYGALYFSEHFYKLHFVCHSQNHREG